MLECASPVRNPQQLPKLLKSISWPALGALAEQHGVIAQLTASLGSLPQDFVPLEFAQRTRDLYRAQVLSSLKMTAELFRLVSVFRTAALDIVLVKGPTLALRAYGDTGARQYGDLDFLLHQTDILHATELMMNAGYSPDVSPNDIRTGKIPGQYLFVRTPAALLVELHSERTMRYFPRGLPIESFFARRQYVSVDGHEVPALSVEDELILICIHGAKHLWERLSLVADVAAYAARQSSLDWERCLSTSREIGADRMLVAGLLLAHNLLRAPLPANILARLQADSSAKRLAAQIAGWLPWAGYAPPGLLSRALFRMRMRGGSGVSALGYLLRLTFSPTEQDWSASDAGNSGGALASLRRPLRLAKKYRAGKLQ